MWSCYGEGWGGESRQCHRPGDRSAAAPRHRTPRDTYYQPREVNSDFFLPLSPANRYLIPSQAFPVVLDLSCTIYYKLRKGSIFWGNNKQVANLKSTRLTALSNKRGVIRGVILTFVKTWLSNIWNYHIFKPFPFASTVARTQSCSKKPLKQLNTRYYLMGPYVLIWCAQTHTEICKIS